jgi:transposase
LACAEGLSNGEVARRLNTTVATVARWRKAFRAEGVSRLHDAPRSGRPRDVVKLSDDEREALARYQRRATVSQRLASRARIVLLCAEGHTDTEVAKLVGVGAATVAKWRTRFTERRLQGLADDERAGAPRKITDDMVEALVVATLESTPKGATHWSTRSMAEKLGISNSSVGRIWRALGLKPHRSETFQLSTDPLFVEKVRDVVGLYMAPPDNAVVLCVDEKSQIQALNRTQPVLPLRPGQVERGTPEYQRNGTTTLFAALDRATGNVIGKCYARHRAVEFRRFLNELRRNVPPELDVHIVVDNYATHSAPTVKKWLANNPRFHFHFIPTHSSWLNQVEGWFSILTNRQLKRGSHLSVDELKTAIGEFIEAWNDKPTPFKWTKSADRILANVANYCSATLAVHGNPDETSSTN